MDLSLSLETLSSRICINFKFNFVTEPTCRAKLKRVGVYCEASGHQQQLVIPTLYT